MIRNEYEPIGIDEFGSHFQSKMVQSPVLNAKSPQSNWIYLKWDNKDRNKAMKVINAECQMHKSHFHI